MVNTDSLQFIQCVHISGGDYAACGEFYYYITEK